MFPFVLRVLLCAFATEVHLGLILSSPNLNCGRSHQASMAAKSRTVLRAYNTDNTSCTGFKWNIFFLSRENVYTELVTEIVVSQRGYC